LDGLVQGSEARETFIDPRALARIALMILVAGLVLALAWWRLIHFPR
jgi:Tfp pilus assembly protein PilO